MVDNSTTAVTATKSGTGWTIDVTNCNLSTDLTLKDFLVEFDSVVQSNSDFTKSSATLLTYNGSSIGSTTVAVYRDTPITRIQEVTYADRITSSLWENEFNRMHRILSEQDTTIRLGSSPVSSDDSTKVATTEWVRDLVGDPDALRLIGAIDDDLSGIGVPASGTDYFVIAQGQATVGDGGGGILWWDESDTATSADGVDVYLVDGVSANGRWKRMSIQFDDLDVNGNAVITGTLTITGAVTATAGIDSSETIALTSDDTTVPTTAWVNRRSADIAKVNGGRLSPTSNTDLFLINYTTTTTISSTSVYFHRYNGDKIALYNTSNSEWELHTIPETPISVGSFTHDSFKPYDIFVYDNAGTLTLEISKWTSTTARSSTIVMQDGVRVLNSNKSRRYIGLALPNSSNEIDVGWVDFFDSQGYTAVNLRNVDNQLTWDTMYGDENLSDQNLPMSGGMANYPTGLGVQFVNGAGNNSDFSDNLASPVTLWGRLRYDLDDFGTGNYVAAVVRFWDFVSGANVLQDSGSTAPTHYLYWLSTDSFTKTFTMQTTLSPAYRVGRNYFGFAADGTTDGAFANVTLDIIRASCVIGIQNITW